MPRRGENIYKRKDGRWEGRYIAGRDPLTNKAVYGYVYAVSYNEARRKKAMAAQEPKPCRPAPMTVAQCFELFLQEKEQDARVRRSTLDRYRHAAEVHILPHLGGLRLDALTETRLSAFRLRMTQHGRADGRGGLAPSTVQTLLFLIGSMQKFAVRNGYAAEVTARAVSRPRQDAMEMRVLTQAEQQRLERLLLEYIRAGGRNAGICLGILFDLYTGLRVGELSALRWRDVDLEQGVVHVRHTLQRVREQRGTGARTALHLGAPKSTRSRRVVPLVEGLLDMLRAYARAQPPERRRPDAPVFAYRGGYCEPRLFQNHFRRLLQQQQIEHANFHAMRHTFASRCIQTGMDVRTLSDILGHSDANVTLRVYVHSFAEQKLTGINRLRFPTAESFSF